MKLSPAQIVWISALRSGRFQQTRIEYANLRESDGFTALGVLCELAKRSGVIADYDPAQDVPPAVTQWLGVRVPYRASLSLADESMTFLQMAAAIEDHAADLFDTPDNQ